MKLDIRELAAAFPDFRVAVLVAEDLAIPAERPDALDRLIAEREAAARVHWGGTELSQIPGVAAWRAAYKAFGIKKTSYRSSVERIMKNALAERPLPRINGFVDAYNAVSLTHVFPAGADDLDKVVGDIAFRYSREGDSFVDMAGEGGEGEGDTPAGPVEDPPKPGEVVFADATHVLCRRWNWRQDARTLVSPATRRAVLTIQSNGAGDLDAAVADAADLIGRVCGGRISVAFADAGAGLIDLPG
ncbi:B3/4 domain-containing protein [Methyloraptor flagellatus]|uniref:Phenylalanine--tRNA ligase beta subunit-related protein n=1 Tax=Methyloraptor flagellatus TaxID=3162530 RepID=A0AAU7XAR4_9HYPH